MNEEEAAGRVEQWLAGRDAEGTSALRVRRDYVVRAEGGWNVTYNTVGWLDGTDPGTGLFPSPVAFVPDDGGEITLDLEMMAVSASGGATDDGFTRWAEVVDPEFDPAAFPELPVPTGAIVRWEQYTLYDQPTGAVRENPDHTPGPRFLGQPKPESETEKLLGYHRAGWIDREQFTKLFLDVDVLAVGKDGHLVVKDHGDEGLRIVVYTSESRVPAEYDTWQRVQPRVLLQRAKEGGGVGFLVNFRGSDPFSVYPWTLQKVSDLRPRPDVERTPVIEHPALSRPEYGEALTALREELGQEVGAATAALPGLVAQARNNEYAISTDELIRYARAATLSFKRSRAKYDRKPLPEMPVDLFANGLVNHFEDDGEPVPRAWTYGKFFTRNTPAGAFGYPQILGAYVGFAIGDALGSGADPAAGLPLGGLTRHLLFQTESVIRGLDATPAKPEIPASLPAGGRPEGWVAKATAHAGPAPAEFSTMLVTALPATVSGGVEGPADSPVYALKVVRELVGSAAGQDVVAGADLLVNLFRAQLSGHKRIAAVANFLEQFETPVGEVGDLVAKVLELRNDVEGDDVEQFDSIGDGRSTLSVLGRALFAAAKRGHEPEAALALAARGGPVVGALTGAMVGARLTVPGLPESWMAAFGDLGVVDNMAQDAYYYFNRFGVIREPGEWKQWEAERYPRGEH